MTTNTDPRNKILVIITSLAVILLFVLLAWIYPQYNVWQKGLKGQATLQEAEYSRKVRVVEAQSRLEAASLEAKAEVERANGQAQANKIISDTLTPEVLQYQYIRVLEEQGSHGDRTIVYIPTDSKTGLPISLPVLESQRLK